MSYHATRVAYARHALRAALRRWSGYLVAAMLVPAMAGSAPVETVLALLAAAGSPLWHAARDPSPLAVLLAVGGTALVAVLPLLAARHWWWPVPWAMAERALPLGARTRRLSDLRMQAWFTAPVLALAGTGLVVLAPHGTAGTRLAALAWLLLAWVLASTLAWGWMQAVRGRAARALCSAATGPAHNASNQAPMRPCHWWWALLGLPLARGRGRGSAAMLLGGVTTTPVLAASPLAGPDAQGVGLMLLALLALPLTAWLQQRLRLMQADWAPALAALPLAPRALGRAVRSLAVAPVMLGLSVASVTLAWAHARPLWSAIWLVAVASSTGLELASRPGTPPADRAARWLISIVGGAALAWETLPR